MRNDSADSCRRKREPHAAAWLMLALVLLGWGAGPALPEQEPAPPLAVIANPDVPVSALSIEDLRAIFLATKTELKQGRHVHPVLQRKGAALTEFSEKYLGKNPTALETYYRSLVFTGKWSMPPMLASDAAVIQYVAKTPGAIGFVTELGAAHGVKAIRVMD